MAHSQDRVAGIGGISICGLIIVAFAIAILCINRYDLYDITGYCAYYSYYYANCYTVSTTCWFSDDPTNNTVPCNYLYSLGSLALFFQFFISLASCLSMGAAIGCMIVMGVMNWGWWLAGAIYFTTMVNQVNNADQPIPGGSYRRAVEGLNWAAFSISTIQVVAMFVAMKHLMEIRGKADQQENHQEMGDYPPAPPPAYPPQPTYNAPPPGAYPPPAGYPPAPAGYPPPPAGYTGYPPPPASYAPPPATGYPAQ